MSAFYLTQRLTRRDGGGSGFDAHFSCDYMGSAEFEWGALPASLKRIRASRKIALHEGTVTRKSIVVPVFVVGDKKTISTIPDLLTEWISDEYPRGKEMTYFDRLIEGTAGEYVRCNAWWSLSDDVMWSLDRNVAEDLLLAVRQ